MHSTPGAAGRQHRVELRERGGRADAAERRDGRAAHGGRIHRRHARQPAGRRKRATRERIRPGHRLGELILRLHATPGLRRQHLRHAIVQFRRHADPKIELQRIAEVRPKIFAQRHAIREPAHHLVGDESKRARAVAVAAILPQRDLPLDRSRHAVVIEDREILRVQCAQSRPVREHLPDGERLLAAATKLRPELHHPRLQRHAAALQRMKHARAGQPLRRGPDQHRRRDLPRQRPRAIAPAVVQRENLLAVLPDRDRRAHLGAAGKILREGRAHACEVQSRRAHRLIITSFRSGSYFAISRNLSSILKLISRACCASWRLPSTAS